MKSTIDVDPKNQWHNPKTRKEQKEQTNTTQCKKTWLLRFSDYDTVLYTLRTSYISDQSMIVHMIKK